MDRTNKKNMKKPICSICKERPQDAALSSCDHAFCMTCIQRWAKEENTCPLCRARFTTICNTTTNQTQAVRRRSQKRKITVRLGNTPIRFLLPRLVNFYQVPQSELSQTNHRLNILRHFILFPRVKKVLLTMFRWGHLNYDWALLVFDILGRFFRLNKPLVPYQWMEHSHGIVQSLFPDHVSVLTGEAEQTKDISVFLFYLKLQGYSTSKMIEKMAEFRDHVHDEEWCTVNLPYI